MEILETIFLYLFGFAKIVGIIFAIAFFVAGVIILKDVVKDYL